MEALFRGGSAYLPFLAREGKGEIRLDQVLACGLGQNHKKVATSVPFHSLGEFRVFDLLIPSSLPLWGCAKSAVLTFFLLLSICLLFENNDGRRWILVGREESLGTQIWPQILAMQARLLFCQER